MTATKTKPNPVAAAYAAEMKALESKLGKDIIHPASVQPQVYKLPFVNPHMNYATEGGAPWDRVIALYGDESTGKTLCALELVAQAQDLPHSAERVLVPRIAYYKELGDVIMVGKLEEELEWIRATFPDGASCLWHDIEGQFDKIRAQKLGVDTDALQMSEAQVIEDFGYLLPFGYKHHHIQVLDSTSAATTQLKLKQAPGQSAGYGVDARQWKDIIRGAQPMFGSTKNGSGIPNMVVMIHQMSTNMKTGGGQAMSTRYMRHASSLSVRFSRGMFLWDKQGVLSDGKIEGADDNSMAGIAEPDGVEVFIKIEKSRTCRPFRTGGMQFDYRTLRYSDIHELATSGIYFGLINKSGSWYSIPGEEKNIGQGLKTVYVRLADDGELRDKILARLLDHARDGK